MKMPSNIALAMMCVGICLGASETRAQSSTTVLHPLVSSEVYGQILDAAFFYEEPKANELLYSMKVRFMSSDHTESQIVINEFNSGKSEAILFRVLGSSAWRIANEYIQRNGTADVDKIARSVRTNKQLLTVSADQVRLWHSGFLKNLAQSSDELQKEYLTLQKTRETLVFLDGTSYELWFNQGLVQIHWQSMDEEVSDVGTSGHSAIAKWMNEVRRFAINSVVK